MAIIGRPRSYYKKFLFTVEVAGVGSAKFQKAGPLEAEAAVIEQWEGGAITAEKSPGRVKVSDVVCDRGATKDLDLWNWFKQVANMAAGTGEVDDLYKRTVDIVQKDRDGTELRRWTMHDAWPSKFVAGDWDNGADGNVIESITIVQKYFDPSDDQGNVSPI